MRACVNFVFSCLDCSAVAALLEMQNCLSGSLSFSCLLATLSGVLKLEVLSGHLTLNYLPVDNCQTESYPHDFAMCAVLHRRLAENNS